ncbi:MAG: hypothetical protein IJ411_01315 [Oscillospiraceae bacterium]|nr:hypothetical protein [Oscillospiraceae bacterium]
MKRIWLCLAAFLLCGVLFLCPRLLSAEDDLCGSWISPEGRTLEITDTHFCIDDISPPYELGKDGAFVLDSGTLGPLDGVYSIQDGVLSLNIEGMNFTFEKS